ncbi:YjaG family protein [Amphritea sp. 1_MG-2023]|uniref:YjaG family protein n=1 Tax=Amphritea sp. 1_MG-2023 TaxID=3062670 RepID=UPI0026E365B8|nr:YjaG family protein [Amphritea sp. 1_MG-2023]MDO6562421.1 YjaG family protein [Amphritea sp. 1_MG-2023]
MSQWLLENELKALDGWQLSAFSVAVTERMLPNFALFSSLLDFGDRHQIRSIIDGVWNKLSNTGATMNFEVQQVNVEANMPDLDVFDMYGASPALDAMVALYSTINCLLEPNRTEAANVGNLSLECVATYIEVTADTDMSDEELLRYINDHEMMLQEERFQAEVIRCLTGVKHPSNGLIKDLKTLAANDGISNIGVSEG